MTPLHEAAYAGSNNVITALINNGADPNAVTSIVS